jgi:D-hydroxyproline dehydrogenase subunit alpha
LTGVAEVGGEREADVVVVGAGPAGLAAAVAARSAGARVAVVDEGRSPGGQIWRQRWVAGGTSPAGLPRDARRWLARVAGSGAELLSGTAVWGVADPHTLLLLGPDGEPARIRGAALVVATGAYDRPVAFPGWTLPGVVTAGGAQALAKAQGVLVGRRVLLAGAGPFLLPVAAQLAAGGAEVVAVAEATRRRDWLRAGPRMLRHLDRLGAYGAYRARLRRAGVPVTWGRVLVRAEGDGRVQRAVLAAADADWRPRPGTEEAHAVDAVCTAYGFLPSVELPRALGCALREDRGGVAHDADQRTSVAHVFVAGEAGGVGGAALATAEGRVAGLAAAAAAGRSRPDGLGAARAKRERLAAFADVLEDLFAPRPGLHELPAPDTPLCRCEDVTAGEVDRAAGAGAHELGALKIATRVGQGPCQGRICAHLVAHRLGGVEPAALFSARPPLRPLPLPALLAADAAGLTGGPGAPASPARRA